MATTLSCDICKKIINGASYKVSVLAGEHPHNGSVMRQTIDVCENCMDELSEAGKLICNVELDDLVKK